MDLTSGVIGGLLCLEIFTGSERTHDEVSVEVFSNVVVGHGLLEEFFDF